MVCSLSFFAVVREASDLCPAAVYAWLYNHNALLFKNTHRHLDGLLGTPRQERKVLDPDSLLIKNSQDVGADGKRQVRFALELDGKRQQHSREKSR